jgi:hypothetical protein
LQVLPVINPDATGIGVGAKEHLVAVPCDRWQNQAFEGDCLTISPNYSDRADPRLFVALHR